MRISKEIFTTCLGNNIRKHRLASGLTVEQLALNSELTYSQVSRIELGKIRTSAFAVYIIVLQSKDTWLLTDLTEKKN